MQIYKWMQKFNALIPNGTNVEDLQSLLLALRNHKIGQKIKYKKFKTIFSDKEKFSCKNSLNLVAKEIEQHDKPVLIGLDWGKEEGHSVVAVGFQSFVSNGNDDKCCDLSSLLILDPSSSYSIICPWNGVLSEGEPNSKKLEYQSQDGEDSRKCKIFSALVLE